MALHKKMKSFPNNLILGQNIHNVQDLSKVKVIALRLIHLQQQGLFLIDYACNQRVKTIYSLVKWNQLLVILLLIKIVKVVIFQEYLIMLNCMDYHNQNVCHTIKVEMLLIVNKEHIIVKNIK